jgi:hypothetical protein
MCVRYPPVQFFEDRGVGEETFFQESFFPHKKSKIIQNQK